MYHVMIVDDELYARMRIKVEFQLEKDGFLVSQEAVSGYEALTKMAENLPDIVLTDMRMPGMVSGGTGKGTSGSGLSH